MSLPPPTPRHNTVPASSLTPSRPAPTSATPLAAAATATSGPFSQQPSIHLGEPSGSLLEEHLKASLRAGYCADVRVRVDRWNRVYKLHKVVLIQAGYFSAMFTGSFAEGEGDQAGGGPTLVEKAKSWARPGEQEVDLRLDDPNISRAAFEILLARLYATGPPLHIFPATHPTPQNPLSPSFPFLFASSSSIPDGAQPASPRFLLSLLATSIFLGMPAVTQSVLTLVLGNVSPWSVGSYLGFAIGRGIGGFEGEDWEDESGAAGAVELEELGKVDTSLSELERTLRVSTRMEGREGVKTENPTPTTSPSRGSSTSLPPSPSPSASASTSSSSKMFHLKSSFHSVSVHTPEPSYFYGLTSAKIGEACAVWLCKWGSDILDVEERTHAVGVMGVEERLGGVSLDGGRSKANASGLSFGLPAATPPSEPATPVTFPPIFSLGGLPPVWIRAICASDAFCVKSELERYKIARRVYELRRAQREAQRVDATRLVDDEEDEEEQDEEEEQFELLFSSGIFYTHMTFEDLAFISQDICPSTGMPYTPISVLQTSLWQHQELKSKILASALSSSIGSTPLSPDSTSSANSVDGAEELGIAVPAVEIGRLIEKAGQKETRRQRRCSKPSARGSVPSPAFASSKSDTEGKQRQVPSTAATVSTSSVSRAGGGLAALESRRYWPVPADDTYRLGGWGGFVDLESPGGSVSSLSNAVADLGPRGRPSVVLDVDPPSPTPLAGTAESEETFFGIAPLSASGAEIAAGLHALSSDEQQRTWTCYQPCRWGVEFFAIDQLREKQRSYSSTIAYAGSLFNCYIQQIRKKDRTSQLGIYLHRQGVLEPVPEASGPPPRSRSSDDPLSESRSPPPADLETLFEPASFSTATSSSILDTSPASLVRSPSAVPSSLLPSASRSAMPTETTPQTTRTPTLAFRDPRKVIKTYFRITCCSALGTALTCFSSAPDVFTVSQSWGWKSSSLRSEEYLSSSEGHVLPEEDTLLWSGHVDDDRLKCLRATVVLGLV